MLVPSHSPKRTSGFSVMCVEIFAVFQSVIFSIPIDSSSLASGGLFGLDREPLMLSLTASLFYGMTRGTLSVPDLESVISPMSTGR